MAGMISNLIARLSLDHSAFDRGMAESRKSLYSLTAESARANTAFLGLVKSGLAIAGIAVSFETARRGIKYCIDAAKEAEKNQRFLEIAMGDSAGAAGRWAEKYGEGMGVCEQETKRFLGSFQMLAEGMGAAPETAEKISVMMTRLTNDMASFARIRPEEAFSKIQLALEGGYRGLRELGIVMSDAKVKQYALNQGWINEGQELSEVQKLYATINLLLDKTAKMQGDLAGSAGTAASEERRLKEALRDNARQLGEDLMPTYKRGLGILNDFVKGLSAIITEAEKAGTAVQKALSSPEGASVAGFAIGGMTALRRGPIGPNLGMETEARLIGPEPEVTAQELARWQSLMEDAHRLNVQAREQAQYEAMKNPGGATDTAGRTRELERFNERYLEEIRNIQFERETLRMTNEEREQGIILHNLENQAIRAETTLSAEQQELLRREIELLQEQQRAAEINRTLAADTVGAWRDVSRALMEGRSAADALRGALLRLVDDLQERLIWKPMEEGLFKALSGPGGGIGGILAGLFGAGGGTSAAMAATNIGNLTAATMTANIPVGFWHTGGHVGIDTPVLRALPAGIFDWAPRLHSGLAADEYPAILRYRETVRTPEQEAKLQSGGRFELHIHDETGLGVEIVDEGIERKVEKTVARLRVRDTLRRRIGIGR